MFSCPNSYVVTRTFTATDECGNDSTASQTITIQDTTNPMLTIPADYTAECSEMHPLDEATATDNCGKVTVEEVADTTFSDCPGNYVVTRTFTATDECGNDSTASQTITIQDTTNPDLTIPADYTAECSDMHPLDEATATDNCGMVTIEEVADTTYSCPNSYVVHARSLRRMSVATTRVRRKPSRFRTRPHQCLASPRGPIPLRVIRTLWTRPTLTCLPTIAVK